MGAGRPLPPAASLAPHWVRPTCHDSPEVVGAITCKFRTSGKESTSQARFSFMLRKVFRSYGIYLLTYAAQNGRSAIPVTPAPQVPDPCLAPTGQAGQCPGAVAPMRR